MADNISFSVTANRTVNFSAYTNAAWQQRITLKKGSQTLQTFTGSGEGNHPIGSYTDQSGSSGATYTVSIEHYSGSWQTSQCGKNLTSDTSTGKTTCHIFSEDSVDNDQNDAILDAVWAT